jgi:hypothetical protein
MTSAMIPRDRPAPADGEIEITPEMIKAGVRAFYNYDERFEPVEMAVIRILQVMVSNQPVQRMQAVPGAEVASDLSPYLGRIKEA